jgi:hypothetical protein
MGERYARRVTVGLEPGEVVVDACWGLGKGMLRWADVAGRARFEAQAEAATSGGEGTMAAPIDRNGILALTDRRLLFLPVKTALGKPKAIACTWGLDKVVGAAWEKPMLTVAFSDGSVGGLHSPADKPEEFVAAVKGAISSR